MIYKCKEAKRERKMERNSVKNKKVGVDGGDDRDNEKRECLCNGQSFNTFIKTD